MRGYHGHKVQLLTQVRVAASIASQQPEQQPRNLLSPLLTGCKTVRLRWR